MKFVSLRTKRAHTKGTSAKPSPTRKTFVNATTAHHEIHTVAELRQQIHHDLRVQHPDWVQPDGESPMCDSYEVRLMQLLDNLAQKDSTESIVDPHRLLEQGAH